MAEITLKVDGMRCPRCVQSVTEKLESLEGVENVNVSLEGKTVDVRFDSRTSIGAIEDAIFELGFETKWFIQAYTQQ